MFDVMLDPWAEVIVLDEPTTCEDCKDVELDVDVEEEDEENVTWLITTGPAWEELDCCDDTVELTLLLKIEGFV